MSEKNAYTSSRLNHAAAGVAPVARDGDGEPVAWLWKENEFGAKERVTFFKPEKWQAEGEPKPLYLHPTTSAQPISEAPRAAAVPISNPNAALVEALRGIVQFERDGANPIYRWRELINRAEAALSSVPSNPGDAP